MKSFLYDQSIIFSGRWQLWNERMIQSNFERICYIRFPLQIIFNNLHSFQPLLLSQTLQMSEKYLQNMVQLRTFVSI